MDIEELGPATESAEEERRVSRRQLTQQAIAYAVQSRWQEAADLNQQLIELAPDDAEAYNRLGKACTELGRIAEARQAYERALEADPANLIAQRNLERLSRISDSEAADMAKKAGQKLDPRFFIEETGKTGVVTLQDTPDSSALATLAAGDQVNLEHRDGQLAVTALDGAYIGRVDEQMATRLIRLMSGGNQYQAGVVSAEDHSVRVIIRETSQAPQNAGRISFPPQGRQETLPRPYLRTGLARRAGDEEEEDDLDMDSDLDVDEDEDEDSSEFAGFHEASMDES